MIFWIRAVPDPDLEICGEGGGGGSSKRGDKRGTPGVPKKFFSAYRASVWYKNKGGGGGAARAPPLDPPLRWSLMGDGGTWRFDCTVFFF